MRNSKHRNAIDARLRTIILGTLSTAALALVTQSTVEAHSRTKSSYGDDPTSIGKSVGDVMDDDDGQNRLPSVRSCSSSGGSDRWHRWSSRHRRVDAGSMAPTLLDLNGDGLNDLVLVSGRGAVTILLNQGKGLFEQGKDFDFDGKAAVVKAANLDSDKFTDLVIAEHQGTVTVFKGDGTGAFTAGGSVDAGTHIASMIVEDVSGDNLPDVLIPNACGEDVIVLLNDGTGGLSAVAPVEPPTSTPSETPTVSSTPGDRPTGTTTPEPTTVPLEPTQDPGVTPTPSITPAITDNPTAEPTKEPTVTSTPTLEPGTDPTVAPTEDPAISPTPITTEVTKVPEDNSSATPTPTGMLP